MGLLYLYLFPFILLLLLLLLLLTRSTKGDEIEGICNKHVWEDTRYKSFVANLKKGELFGEYNADEMLKITD
jgi:hypothetical protein